MQTLIVHLVHGTWPQGPGNSILRAVFGLRYASQTGKKYWFQDGHRFGQQLVAELGQAGFAAELRPFIWSGFNSFAARRRAAAEFISHLAVAADQGARQLIVAHSHGGTVAMLALDMIERAELPGLAADHQGRWTPQLCFRLSSRVVAEPLWHVPEVGVAALQKAAAGIELSTLATPFLRVVEFASSRALWATFATLFMIAEGALAARLYHTVYSPLIAGVPLAVCIVAVALRPATQAARTAIQTQACRFKGGRLQCVRGLADEAGLAISAGIIGCSVARGLLVLAGRLFVRIPSALVLLALLGLGVMTWSGLLVAPDALAARILAWCGGLSARLIALLVAASALQGLLGSELILVGYSLMTSVDSSPDAAPGHLEVVTLDTRQDTSIKLHHALYEHEDCIPLIVSALNVPRPHAEAGR